jgi:sugar-specific transcriptional regulator TrmB
LGNDLNDLNGSLFAKQFGNYRWKRLFETESVQVLINLGLSKLQADIYLALCKAERPVTIKAVSKAANMARQDVYRLMPSLEKLGLAEKVLAKPMLYKATPMPEGCRFLLEKKNVENAKLQRKTLALINSLNEAEYQGVSEPVEALQFAVISSEQLLKRRFDEKDHAVQKSLDVIVDWNFLRFRLSETFEEYSNALERGVKIRFLTENHEADNTTKKILEKLLQNPLFDVRCLSEPLPVHLVIHDGLELLLGMDAPLQSLESTNPQFVQVIEAYFEGLWRKATILPWQENRRLLTV